MSGFLRDLRDLLLAVAAGLGWWALLSGVGP